MLGRGILGSLGNVGEYWGVSLVDIPWFSRPGNPYSTWIPLDTLGYLWTRLDTLGHAWIRLDTLGYAWEYPCCRRPLGTLWKPLETLKTLTLLVGGGAVGGGAVE